MQASVTKPDEVVVVRLATTSAGNVGGTTLVCSTLTDWPNLDGSSVKILSGTYKGQSRAISGSTLAGTITVSPAFSGQIAAGVKFSIIGLPSTAVDVAAINGKIGTNADAAGTITLFARLRQIVDTYLADGTIGLAALRALINAVGVLVTAIKAKTDNLPPDPADESTLEGVIAAAHTVTDGKVDAVQADVTAIKAKTDLMNSAMGTATLNDANPSDTIVPTSLPTKMHLIFDISNLNNNGDDFDIAVSVGTAANERVVAWYNLTSDGTDITCDTGNGVGTIIKQRRIDISDILVYTSEQVIVTRTKNSVTDRDVVYEYGCGV
jgi:hypothetical protein